MHHMECPPGSRPSCREIAIGRLPARMCGSASKLVVTAFPHMNIPVDFWRNKICSDASIGAMENGTDLVGIATVADRGSSTASLDLLAVDPPYQGKGIGSKLLSEAEIAAARSGNKIMTLTTEQIKPENVAFYSSRGYKVTGYDPRGYEHSPSVDLEKRVSISRGTINPP